MRAAMIVVGLAALVAVALGCGGEDAPPAPPDYGESKAWANCSDYTSAAFMCNFGNPIKWLECMDEVHGDWLRVPQGERIAWLINLGCPPATAIR